MPAEAFVHILANRPLGTLYVGVTSDLNKRMYEHRHHVCEGFTATYDITKLVWFAKGTSIVDAIALEKKIKNRGRAWKLELLGRHNPEWKDLSADW